MEKGNCYMGKQLIERLVPCPYCGDRAEIIQVDAHEYFVRCKNGCVEQCKLYPTIGEAIKKWNRRTDS